MKEKMARCYVCAAVLVLSAFQVGAEMAVTSNMTLTEDTDWRAQGTVTVAAGVTVDLNGHKLAVKGLSCAGNIINSESGYQPLQYIQSNGKQWIDTGYLTTDKTAIEIAFTVTGDWGNKAYFCGDWADYGHLLVLKKPDNKANTIAFYGNGETILSGGTNKRYRFITVPGGANAAILFDGSTGEQLVAASPSLAHSAGSGNMTLFAADEAGQYPATYRLHAFKLTDTATGKVERDYVPVRRFSDGELGLYDRVHDVFYPKHENSTAAFTAGADAAQTVVAAGRLVVDVSDGAAYAVSGACNVRVEILDGSALAADGDLRCFGKNLELNGQMGLNDHRLRVVGLGGSGVVQNGGYRYYRFKVDALRSGTMMQIGEVKLFSGDVEVSKDYAKLTWGSTSKWSDYRPDKALDGNTGTKWFDDASLTGCGPGLLYFDLEYAAPIAITRYAWYTGDDTKTNSGRNPKSWRLQGSNDGTNWTNLDVVENNTSVTTSNQALAYDKVLTDVQNRTDALEVEVSDSYRYYKFKVDAVRSGAMMQIGEIKLFSGDTDVSRQYTALDYNLNTSFKDYTPEKCFDGLYGEKNKWFDNRSADYMYFILDFGEPRAITRYAWYTGDDTSKQTGRNPKSWRLQGSNDGTTWRDLDVVSDNTSVPTANSTLAYEKDFSAEVTARLMGVAALVKSGVGSVLVPDTVLASVANVAVDAGVVKVKRTGFVKAASTPGEIHIADGAQLDLNAAKTSVNTLSVAEAIHGKTIFVAGEGPNGKGAIYNSLDVQGNYTGPQLGAVVLTDDTLLGSANGRIDMRAQTGSSAAATAETSLLSGGHLLTVGDMGGGFFGMNNMAYALGGMRVTGRASFEQELTGTITNGVRMADGAWVQFYSATVGADIPFVVEQNATATVNVSGASAVSASFTVGAGAAVSVASASDLTVAGAVTNEGAVTQTGANALIFAGMLAGGGSLSGAKVRFSGADSCWRMVADDTGFTNKVNVDGVTDAAFLSGLKRMEIVYTGAVPDGKVLTICSVAACSFTQADAINLPLIVTDGAGNPIANCWLEVADGLLKIHFAERVPRTAEWTNESGDGNVANSENWICRDEDGQQISDAVPMNATTVLIGANCQFVCTNAAPLLCGKVKFETGASLAADCDWRGLAGVPFEGTLDLAGHALTVGSLDGAATLTDSGHGAGYTYIRFKINQTRGSVLHAESGRDSNDSAQLCEVKLFNGTSDITRSYKQLIYDETTFDSVYKAKFNPNMAVDGNLETEWFDNRMASEEPALRDSVWFILEYETPIVLTHYEWYSGLDTTSYSNRHPQEWQLEGSNDGVNWVMLDALHTRAELPGNQALAYRGQAMDDPATTPGEVRIDVPAGQVVTNATVALQNGVRLVKMGAGTFVAACADQAYAGGTVVREGVVKPDANAGTSAFGMKNSALTVEKGAQYWDDVYAPWAAQYMRFRIAGTGPDGTGAIRTSHAATGGINNAEKGWLAALELTDDAEIARDAYAFSLIANLYLKFPMTLNGHTLTFTSDTLGSSPNYPYFLASSLQGTPGDTGTIVIGDNIQFYPYKEHDSDISAYTLVITENASYSSHTDGNGRNLTVGNLIYRSASELSQTQKLTTVLGCYAPVSTTSAPMVKLGDATHHQVALDVSARTTPFNVAQGGGLTFDEEATVTVKLGAREPRQMEPLVLWAKRPTGTIFKGEGRCHIIVTDTGIYYTTGLMIIVR